ncbi:hypothetical protein [Azospirillum sp.]|uniref:hypothetical protein n=1 Tax=Azospirillum sp. TaxID=34012 RepID=UPI003D7608E9
MSRIPLRTSIVGGGAALSPARRAVMFDLLGVWFEGYGEDYFNEELDGVDHCVLQEEPDTGQLVGFATLYQREPVVDGRAVGLFHTLHCILDRRHWGSNALVRAMVAFMLDHARGEDGGRPWYWHYSAVGYRSYRYMPSLFRRHAPNPEQALDPFDRAVRDWVGRTCFEQYYDTESGLVDWNWQGYGLTEAARAISEAKLDSPGVSLFRAVNPRWADSVEVLCQARLSDDNLTDFARRWFPPSPVSTPVSG